MRCPTCGISNADSQRFCGACGAVIAQSEAETGLAIYAAWVSIGNQKVFKEAVLN